MAPILSVRNLTKQFGSGSKQFKAVDGISFDISEGEIVGLLGPNGAGKTTTIQVLLGLTLMTSGSISYFGKDFYRNKSEILQQINFTSAFNTLQARTTVYENLLVFAELYQIDAAKKKVFELAEQFEMTDLLDVQYSNLSAGQRTRTNFVKALLNKPKIILMDEPTASLDPDIADKILSMIEDLRRNEHTTILYTSHNMQEVTRICDRVIFLDHGRIVAQDTPLGLTKRIQVAQLRLTYDGNKQVIEQYCEKNNPDAVLEGETMVIINTNEKQIPAIIFDLSKLGIWITDIDVKKPTLEHVFLQIARGKTYVFQKN